MAGNVKEKEEIITPLKIRLCRRLAVVGTRAIATSMRVICNSQPTQSTREKGKGVTGTIRSVERSSIVGCSTCRSSMVDTRERSLSSRVAKRRSPVRGWSTSSSRSSSRGSCCCTVASVTHLMAHWSRVSGSGSSGGSSSSSSSRTTTQTGWQAIVAWGELSCPAKLLMTKSTKGSASGGSKGTRRRGCAGHRVGTHAKGRRRRRRRMVVMVVRRTSVHRRREGRVSHDGSTRTRSTTSQTVDVLGEVMIATALRATLPVTSTERNHSSTATTTAATHTSTAVAHAVTTAAASSSVTTTTTSVHVRRHHGWRTVTVSCRTVSNRVGGRSHGGERAAEARRATLEVREATRRASPVTGTRTVLRRGERGQDLGRTVQHTTGRGRDLDGFLVESPAVHAETLRSLFMGRKDGEPSASGLVLIGSTQGPEGNGTTAKLGEPALQFGLGGVMGQPTEVQDLAAFSQEGTHISPGIHGPGQDLWVLMRGLGFADQAPEDAGQSDGLFHGPARRRRSQRLQMEGQVVLDRGRRLHGFDFESSTDVGQRAGPKGQRLRVMRLPSLVFGAQVEGARVLQIRRQDDGLVAGLTGQLHPQIPRIQRHKRKLEVLADQMFLGERIEPVDGITKGTCRADMLPCQSGQARCQGRPVSPLNPADIYNTCIYIKTERKNLLQRGVIGVLTGFTSTLSRCN